MNDVYFILDQLQRLDEERAALQRQLAELRAPMTELERVEAAIVSHRSCIEMGLAGPTRTECEQLWRRLEAVVVQAAAALSPQRIADASAQIATWLAVTPIEPQLSLAFERSEAA